MQRALLLLLLLFSFLPMENVNGISFFKKNPVSRDMEEIAKAAESSSKTLAKISTICDGRVKKGSDEGKQTTITQALRISTKVLAELYEMTGTTFHTMEIAYNDAITAKANLEKAKSEKQKTKAEGNLSKAEGTLTYSIRVILGTPMELAMTHAKLSGMLFVRVAERTGIPEEEGGIEFSADDATALKKDVKALQTDTKEFAEMKRVILPAIQNVLEILEDEPIDMPKIKAWEKDMITLFDYINFIVEFINTGTCPEGSSELERRLDVSGEGTGSSDDDEQIKKSGQNGLRRSSSQSNLRSASFDSNSRDKNPNGLSRSYSQPNLRSASFGSNSRRNSYSDYDDE
jgi:hypothetical protein